MDGRRRGARTGGAGGGRRSPGAGWIEEGRPTAAPGAGGPGDRRPARRRCTDLRHPEGRDTWIGSMVPPAARRSPGRSSGPSTGSGHSCASSSMRAASTAPGCRPRRPLRSTVGRRRATRAARPAARRPVVGQPPHRRARSPLARRPGAHGGHRETDLAMRLFGGLRTEVLGAYQEVAPSPTAGRTASRCTSCTHCSCTPPLRRRLRPASGRRRPVLAPSDHRLTAWAGVRRGGPAGVDEGVDAAQARCSRRPQPRCDRSHPGRRGDRARRPDARPWRARRRREEPGERA